MAEKRKPRFFRGYIVVGAACCILAVTWGANRTFGVFFEPLIKEFGWARASISGAVTLCFVFTGLLSIAGGRLNDRFGPKILVMACGVLMGLGYLLLSQLSNIWHLYLYFGIIIGIGQGGTDVPMFSMAARWFVKRRGLMTGVVSAGPALGITVMPLLASWLIYRQGWRFTYVVIGIIVLVLIIIAAQILRRDPAQLGQQPYGEGTKTGNQNSPEIGFSLGDAIHTGRFYLLAAIYFASTFNINVVLVHTVIHATGVGILPITAASILAATAAVSIAGRITAGMVADRIGSRRTLVTAFSLHLAAFLLLLGGNELWMFYLFALLFGLGGWAADIMVSMMVAEFFGTRSHGLILAVLWCVGSIGGAIGPVVAGYIFDIRGSYQLAFLSSVVLSVIAILLAVALGRPQRIERFARGV